MAPCLRLAHIAAAIVSGSRMQNSRGSRQVHTRWAWDGSASPWMHTSSSACCLGHGGAPCRCLRQQGHACTWRARQAHQLAGVLRTGQHHALAGHLAGVALSNHVAQHAQQGRDLQCRRACTQGAVAAACQPTWSPARKERLLQLPTATGSLWHTLARGDWLASAG